MKYLAIIGILALSACTAPPTALPAEFNAEFAF